MDIDQHHPEITNGAVRHKPENILVADGSIHSIFPDSKYNWDVKYKENFMDRIRKEVENCDKIGGVLLIAAMGGGTGSGLTALLNT